MEEQKWKNTGRKKVEGMGKCKESEHLFMYEQRDGVRYLLICIWKNVQPYDLQLVPVLGYSVTKFKSSNENSNALEFILRKMEPLLLKSSYNN